MYLLKSSTLVGINFENYLPEVAKMHVKSSTVVGANFKTTNLKWLIALKIIHGWRKF
jgi:hypothetical protein